MEGETVTIVRDSHALELCLTSPGSEPLTVVGLDLTRLGPDEVKSFPDRSLFLGCRLQPDVVADLIAAGSSIAGLPNVPYDPARDSLYTPDELFVGFDPREPDSYQRTLDARIYTHYLNTGKERPSSDAEALSRRLHDHHVGRALDKWISDRRVVGIMGGHSLERGSSAYAAVVRLGRALGRAAFAIATGGGPGAMEAGHLGAWLVNAPDHMLEDVIEHLSGAPSYKDAGWLSTAFEVRTMLETYESAPSVGVPTWLYGHEPPTPFAPVIAKYFENSLREDGLVTIGTRGIVFAPGSAGTVQEIFQDAAQNHYGTVGKQASPMVLLGTSYWSSTLPVHPLLCALARDKEYRDLIALVDDVEDAVAFISEREPIPVG